MMITSRLNCHDSDVSRVSNDLNMIFHTVLLLQRLWINITAELLERAEESDETVH